MKYILLFCISLPSINCFAQRDTSETKPSHRFWISPTQIASGHYTLSYGLRFNRNNWIEVGGGYKYIPYSIVEELPIAPQKFFELFADPEHGIGFTGPVAMLSVFQYYENQFFNGVCLELFYQHLTHPPDCYYDPGREYHDHYTYSSTKDNYGAKFFLLRTLASSNHLISEWYLGGGFRLGYGETTTYYMHKMYPSANDCVDDIHDPDVLTFQTPFNYFTVSANIGIRLGLQ
jgi:hypothetical protein